MTTVANFDYDISKTGTYFEGARRDWIDMLPLNQSARALEVGCGNGDNGALAMSAGKCGEVIGIEIAPMVAEVARSKLTEVLVGNIETMELTFPKHSFDVIMVSEVLEHLVDPWDVVRRLSDLLRPGGIFLASSPNVAHFRVVMNLLKGRWDLADSGTMDWTHLRWFTPKSYIAMFVGSGLEVTHQGPVAPLTLKRKLVSYLSGGKVDHLLQTQINVHARKPLLA